MRVLHVYRTYFPDPPGGLLEAIRQICLATHGVGGVEPRVFTLSPTPIPTFLERPEATVIRSRSWGAPGSCDLGGIDAFLRFRECAAWADILHYHFPWPFADVLHLTMGSRKPAIITYHSDIVRQRRMAQLYAPLMHCMLGRMSAVVATSPAYAATSPVLTSVVPPNRLRVIPLGMVDETAEPAALADAAPVLRRFGLENGSYVLALGVLRYYKGLHTLVEAAPDIPAKIVIAGSGPQGDALRALAAERKADNVFFTGQVTGQEKFALLRGCRVLALPSHLRSEAFGMVLLEAAMFGKPMVCCEVGSGTSFVNQHQETGFVVPPESPQALAKAINMLVADNALAARMGVAARQRYEQLFSGQALGNAYRELYRETLKENNLK